MKIIQTAQRFHPACGGLETHVLEVSKRLSNHNCDVSVFTSDYIDFNHKTSDSYSKFKQIDIYRFYAFKYGYNFLYFMPKLPYRLLKSKCDILHAHGYGYFQCDAARIVRQMKRKIFVLTPHYHPPVSILRRLYDKSFGKSVLRHADAIIALTKTERNLLSDLGAFSDKMITIPNGITISELRYTSNLDKIKTDLGAMNKKIILTVGRLEERKRFDKLLHIFKTLTYDYPKIKLVIVGPDFGVKAKLITLSSRLNILDKVLFLGYVDSDYLHKLYQAADVFVLPSLYEAWSITALEAQYFGLIPVSSNLGGIQECVINNKTGFLVDSDSNEEFLNAIKKVLDESETIQRMKSNAKEWAKMFDWDIIVKHILRVYKCVLKGLSFENCSYNPTLST